LSLCRPRRQASSTRSPSREPRTSAESCERGSSAASLDVDVLDTYARHVGRLADRLGRAYLERGRLVWARINASGGLVAESRSTFRRSSRIRLFDRPSGSEATSPLKLARAAHDGVRERHRALEARLAHDSTESLTTACSAGR